jgi:hypothetical protein
LASINKFTVLSDTDEKTMRKLAIAISKAFVRKISVNPNEYGLEREDIMYVGLIFAEMCFQLLMKSVEGGERIYRGKIIKVETRAETKEEPSLRLPLKR